MSKKNLLISEPPLQVLPSLAKTIGLNEAMVLQQVHYWIENPKAGVDRDGFRWVYNTYEDWQKDNFPFWSVRTIQRIFLNLEKDGLIISEQLDKSNYERRKYYRIDYDKLALLNVTDAPPQDRQGEPSDSANLTPSLNESETTTEITTEITTEEEEVNPLFALYMNTIGFITPIIADSIEKAEKTYSAFWVADAIAIAEKNNARSWRYCEVVLERWKTEGRPERKNGKKQSVAASGDNSKYANNPYSEYLA